jgi:general secretion pathway protein J
MRSVSTRSAALSLQAAGFTLIEMLVAVTLMALIGIAVTDGLRLARRSLQTAATADRDSWEIVAAQRFLRRALESTEPGGSAESESGTGVKGEGSRLTFRAAGPLSVNEGIPSVFDIRVVPETRNVHQQDLVVRWQAQTADTDLASDVANPGEVLVTGVRSVRWQYLPASLPSDGITEASAWLDEWKNRSDLPALIRLEVIFAPGSRRIWPPLVVRLRLTHDAGCVFDVVAQDCRKAG